MAKPIFYQPRPRWHFLGSLVAALAIEAAAVGVASIHHEEAIPEETGLFQTEPVEAIITMEEAEATPPPEEEPPPPPPPDEPTEFVIQEPTPPPRPPSAPTPAPRKKVSASLGQVPTSATYSSAKANMVSAPRPAYPYEARRSHTVGSGKFLIHFDSSGNATDVEVTQSTGSPILDQTTTSTFRRWRCKPGVYSKVYVPITFTMAGAQF